MTCETIRIIGNMGVGINPVISATAAHTFEIVPQAMSLLWESMYTHDEEEPHTKVTNVSASEEKSRYEARAALLDEAQQLVCHDRNAHYGPPTMNFSQFAAVANTLGYRGPGEGGPGTSLLTSHDTAVLQLILKLVRIMWSPQRRDNWADTAGYAACGWECVVEEQEAASSRDAAA